MDRRHAICRTCAALHTAWCPDGPSAPEYAEDLHAEVDIEVTVRARRRELGRPTFDAVTELVLRAQLCPDELLRTREWEHRQN